MNVRFDRQGTNSLPVRRLCPPAVRLCRARSGRVGWMTEASNKQERLEDSMHTDRRRLMSGALAFGAARVSRST
jgi:hypothetical protein